jgi:hypothetical protein
MVGVNKRTNCLIVVIDDLESTIRDIAFHCFVLNRYGNFDKITPYNYLHADVIDIHSICIIIITIGGSLINFHKDKFTKGNPLRIENFTFQTGEKFERGDLDLSLQLTTSTKVLILDKLDYSLHFLMRTLLHLSTRGFMTSGQ